MHKSFFRGRRLRRIKPMRELVAETKVTVGDLIQPLFVEEGTNIQEPIPSMDGICRWSVDLLEKELDALAEAKVGSLIVFGMPLASKKDAGATEAFAPNGAAQNAIRFIKEKYPQFLVISDVCLCAYTDSGHCGVMGKDDIDNDASLEVLGKVALSHAQAGADVVAPSDMMDGRVGYIRQMLDENGLHQIPILSYAAKYASAFYGPFRDATDCAPQKGDRQGYQMDPRNQKEAMREIAADLEEGADMVMVKPALAYLDVIHEARLNFEVPIFAYNVSGEFAMIKAAAAKGWLKEELAVREMLTSIKRAGADRILTYFARDFAKYFG